jgi:hypothetical protein
MSSIELVLVAVKVVTKNMTWSYLLTCNSNIADAGNWMAANMCFRSITIHVLSSIGGNTELSDGIEIDTDTRATFVGMISFERRMASLERRTPL